MPWRAISTARLVVRDQDGRIGTKYCRIDFQRAGCRPADKKGGWLALLGGLRPKRDLLDAHLVEPQQIGVRRVTLRMVERRHLIRAKPQGIRNIVSRRRFELTLAAGAKAKPAAALTIAEKTINIIGRINLLDHLGHEGGHERTVLEVGRRPVATGRTILGSWDPFRMCLKGFRAQRMRIDASHDAHAKGPAPLDHVAEDIAAG